MKVESIVTEDLGILGKVLSSVASGKLNLKRLVKRANLEVIQKAQSIVAKSSDGQYIIKIFPASLAKQKEYEQEKTYLRYYNPYQSPKLIYCDDTNRILVMENLCATGELIPQFCFIQAVKSRKKLIATCKSAADSLAIHHLRFWDTYGSVIDKGHIDSERTQGYFESEFNNIASMISRLANAGYADIPEAQEFARWEKMVAKEKFVLNHSDFTPWNIFVHRNTGRVVACTDSAAMASSASRDLAVSIVGLINARKNNPLLVSNIDLMVRIFVLKYAHARELGVANLLKTLPFYLPLAFLEDAVSAHEKWHSPLWTEWNLKMANHFLDMHRISLSDIVMPFRTDYHSINIKWVGDVYPKLGAKTRLKSGKPIKIYTSAYVPDNRCDTLTGSNLAAQIWAKIENAWQAFPMEFVGYESDNYRFRGILNDLPSGKHTFTARVSGNGGHTWVWPSLPKYNGMLIVEPISLDRC